MSTFLSYNTDDTTAPSGTYPVLGGAGSITLGPIMAGVASKVAGSVFADQAGTCTIQQSFDYFLSGGTVNPSPHFDVVQFPVGAAAGAVTANTAFTINSDVLAPVIQVVFTNGATPQTAHFRLFVRVFGVHRG